MFMLNIEKRSIPLISFSHCAWYIFMVEGCFTVCRCLTVYYININYFLVHRKNSKSNRICRILMFDLFFCIRRSGRLYSPHWTQIHTGFFKLLNTYLHNIIMFGIKVLKYLLNSLRALEHLPTLINEIIIKFGWFYTVDDVSKRRN